MGYVECVIDSLLKLGVPEDEISSKVEKALTESLVEYIPQDLIRGGSVTDDTISRVLEEMCKKLGAPIPRT